MIPVPHSPPYRGPHTHLRRLRRADAIAPAADPRDPIAGGIRLTPGVATWLAVAVVGAFLITAWPVLAHLYWIEQAGSLLDRDIVKNDRAALVRAEQILGLRAAPEGAHAPAPPPEEGSFADSPDYWRTYGAVAARAPSETAFGQLEAAKRRGKLDRMGRLWLGEVAASTGHWDVAAEEYSNMGAVNVLVDRGDEAAAARHEELAAHWYDTAAASLLASIDARQAGMGVSPSREEVFDSDSGRTILLLRIGRGLLRVDAVQSALPVLERAESELHANPPGIKDQQAIRFALAEALAKTLPADTTAARDQKSRIGALVDRAVASEETGWARLQEAKVRLLAGQRALATQALRISLRLDHRSVEAHLTMGGLLERDGLLSLARDQYARGLEAVPGDPGLLGGWAKTSYATMDPALALPRLLEAAETDTRDPYVFVALGNCLLDLGDQEGARSAYREGLRRAPGADPLRDRMARFARPTGRAF